MKFRKKEAKRKNVSVCLHHNIFSPGKIFSQAEQGLCVYQAMLFSIKVHPKALIPCLASCLFITNVIYHFHVYQNVSALDPNFWALEGYTSLTLN